MRALGDQARQKLNVTNEFVPVANLQLWRRQHDGMTLLLVEALPLRYLHEDGAQGVSQNTDNRKLRFLGTERCDQLWVKVVIEKQVFFVGKIAEKCAWRNLGFFGYLFNGCCVIALFNEESHCVLLELISKLGLLTFAQTRSRIVFCTIALVHVVPPMRSFMSVYDNCH